jgi:hypothetical protein
MTGIDWFATVFVLICIIFVLKKNREYKIIRREDRRQRSLRDLLLKEAKLIGVVNATYIYTSPDSRENYLLGCFKVNGKKYVFSDRSWYIRTRCCFVDSCIVDDYFMGKKIKFKEVKIQIRK